MTDIIDVGTVVSVGVGSYDSDCIQIAKDILQGCYRDYYFFQYDDDDYCVLVADKLEFSSGGCSGEDVTVYQFTKIAESESVPYSIQIPFNGQYAGVDGAGGVNGSSIYNYVEAVENVSFKYLEPYTVNSATVINSGYLVYGSGDSLPHLVEGVEIYAFTFISLAIAVITYNIGNRIFRRFY